MKKNAAAFFTAAMVIVSVFSTAFGENTAHAASEETEFSMRLFQNSMQEDRNTLVSPLSVLNALAMTANGAQGETLAQMEEVLGLPVDEWNEYFNGYSKTLPSDENCRLLLANSIWCKDDGTFSPEEDFLEKNETWYNAGIHQIPFDENGCAQINDWVKERTEGMIETLLDQIPSDAVMYLVNALAFDGKWEEPYEDVWIQDGVFTNQDGAARDVTMMYSTEEKYLEDEDTTGFLKYYEGGRLAFAAFLPREDVKLADYVSGFSGQKLTELLENAQAVEVDAAIPQFESDACVEMSGVLQAMGMKDAFDENLADFSGLGTSTDGNIFINRVLHKTFLSVDEKGTKAAAATAVEMVAECAEIVERKVVHLDRPFVYMLVDSETELPVFVGAVVDL